MIIEVPHYSLYFGTYELSRYFFKQENESKNDIGVVRTMTSGAIGGKQKF